MDTSKIIKGVVNSGRYTVTAPIIKEDYGLYLQIEGVELPSTYQVDFSNDEHHGTSVTMIGNADGVLIPHQFIDTGKDIFAFLYHVGANYGRTVYKFRIPNKVRPDRTNEEPTPEEQSVIDQAISALNTAVAQTAQDVIDADASAQSAQGYAEQAEDARDNAQTYANNASASATSASQSATASANSATASAQSASQSAQIKADVEDLAEDAQGYANSAQQSASQASASEQGCARAVLDAASAAAIARARAEEASGYAQTATAKASEASTSASTASTKASESAQSASQALSYKTDAESAKTASQTAQGLAESARDSAQGYAEDAQGYANDAQASAESISASASQIAQNTADILKAFPTDTASGSVTSFPDGADNIPLKSLVVNINPVQSGTGDPSPENICPISGWTGCNIYTNNGDEYVTNIPVKWDTTSTEKYIGANGEVGSSANFHYTELLPIYTGSFKFTYYNPTTVNFTTRVHGYNASGEWVRQLGYINGVQEAGTHEIDFDVADDIKFIKISQRNSTTDNVVIGQGSHISISWQTEAGTVYGGKLDVLSGVLRVDRATDDMGNLTWIAQGSAGMCYSTSKRNTIKKGTSAGGYDNAFAEIYSASNVPIMANLQANQMSVDNGGNIQLYDTRFAGMTGTQIKAETQGVTMCYKLAEPIEIQLTPRQVNSLLGDNNIWADTGDTEVEYRADTKLYIEKLTQPEEDDMIANSAITSGQFFMIGNTLYRALTNIASGATITVGTNAQRVSLSDALNLVNT